MKEANYKLKLTASSVMFLYYSQEKAYLRPEA